MQFLLNVSNTTTALVFSLYLLIYSVMVHRSKFDKDLLLRKAIPRDDDNRTIVEGPSVPDTPLVDLKVPPLQRGKERTCGILTLLLAGSIMCMIPLLIKWYTF